MQQYARQRRLRRVMIPVPVLTPRISSLGLGFVTPLFARVGRTLIESLCHETIVQDDRGRRDFAIEPVGAKEESARSGATALPARTPAILQIAAAVLLGLLCACEARAASPELARADALWAQRAEGHVAGQARPEPVRAAIAAYEGVLAADPRNLEATWKLMRARWFSAEFGAVDASLERETHEQAQAVAKRAFAVLSERVGGRDALENLSPEALGERMPSELRRDAAEIYFWHALNLGAWSRSAGLLQAVRKGVAGHLHQATLRSIALDPGVEQGGALRLLSRLHSELPRVPLLSGWVDHKRAVPLARRALAKYPEHPGNAYLLGLALLSNEPEQREEAWALIERAATLEPRSDQVLEDLAIQQGARKTIEEERSRAD